MVIKDGWPLNTAIFHPGLHYVVKKSSQVPKLGILFEWKQSASFSSLSRTGSSQEFIDEPRTSRDPRSPAMTPSALIQ